MTGFERPVLIGFQGGNAMVRLIRVIAVLLVALLASACVVIEDGAVKS